MPDRNVLHVTHAFAFRGARNQHERLRPRSIRDRAVDRGRIMAVHLHRFPSEGAHLVEDRIKIGMHLAGLAEGLKIVQVQDADDSCNPKRGREHHRLPNGAFLEFTVAHDDEDDSISAPHLVGRGHAHGQIQPMTERTGRRLDSREAIIGMGGKTSARFAVEIEFGFGNNPQRIRGPHIVPANRDLWR